MKTLATVGALALLSTLIVMHAVGADAPNRPPGVTAAEWAPVSDTLGIVLMQQNFGAGAVPIAPGQAGALLLNPPANGYFMVKRGSRWIRLVVVEPFKGPGDAG